MKIAKYFFITLILSLALIGIGFILTTLVFEGRSPIFAGAGVLTGFLSALVAFVITFRGLKKRHVKFFGSLVGGMGLKVLLGLGAITVVALFFRPNIYEFVIAFFISYLVFTAFEVYSLNRNLRAENSGSTETTPTAEVEVDSKEDSEVKNEAEEAASQTDKESSETNQETVSNDK